ncbi:MAG: hydroxyacid dehydrogenase [Deltaproteobacteria bacterium HGW-Deltaproteobacteria-15]|nr:MAG: hydroxyacid dehydrogenase [Deltaproteobacteria bacterium HGW-Deltaproteobacteria-15]
MGCQKHFRTRRKKVGFKVVNTLCTPGIDFGEKHLDGLGVTLVKGEWHEEEELINHSQGADAIICSGPSQPWTSRVIRTLSRCRILATPSIGYDRIDVDAATEQSIAVTNVPDYCIDEVSNQAIALLMALHRKIVTIDKAVRDEQAHLTPFQKEALEKHACPIHRLQNQTLGIIGFGKIGTTVALKARGLGLRVIAYDPYVYGPVMKSHGADPVDLDTLFTESDYVSIHAFLSDETRAMVGEKAFRRMKPSSYLINTARGPIVDQQALIRALKEGRIAGAGLDVTAVEPIPKEDPILGFSNVILSGHSAWYSTASNSNEELWHKAALQVASALKGEWPCYAVNPQAKKEWLQKWRSPVK